MTSLMAPDFRVELPGTDATALRNAVASVRHQSGLEGADRVDVTLGNDALHWLDQPAIRPGQELRLSIGYAPQPLDQVFVGGIVGRSVSVSSGGLPTLAISAQDYRQRLQEGTATRRFGVPTPIGEMPLDDPMIARLVAAENAMTAAIDPITAALSVFLTGAEAVSAGFAAAPGQLQKLVRRQTSESDADFLARIAKENGWELLVDHSGPAGGHSLRFLSPLGRLSPENSLTYGTNLVDFSARTSTAGQIASVTTNVWVSEIQTTFAISVGWDWDAAALTLEISPHVGTRVQPAATSRIVDKPLTPATAPRVLVRDLLPRLYGRLTGSGTAVGDTGIHPGSVIEIKNLGTEFGGLYRVTSVTHTVDSGGFRTGFEVRKEPWFERATAPGQPVSGPRATVRVSTA
jgi:phage protein D